MLSKVSYFFHYNEFSHCRPACNPSGLSQRLFLTLSIEGLQAYILVKPRNVNIGFVVRRTCCPHNFPLFNSKPTRVGLSGLKCARVLNWAHRDKQVTMKLYARLTRPSISLQMLTSLQPTGYQIITGTHLNCGRQYSLYNSGRNLSSDERAADAMVCYDNLCFQLESLMLFECRIQVKVHIFSLLPNSTPARVFTPSRTFPPNIPFSTTNQPPGAKLGIIMASTFLSARASRQERHQIGHAWWSPVPIILVAPPICQYRFNPLLLGIR